MSKLTEPSLSTQAKLWSFIGVSFIRVFVTWFYAYYLVFICFHYVICFVLAIYTVIIIKKKELDIETSSKI